MFDNNSLGHTLTDHVRAWDQFLAGLPKKYRTGRTGAAIKSRLLDDARFWGIVVHAHSPNATGEIGGALVPALPKLIERLRAIEDVENCEELLEYLRAILGALPELLGDLPSYVATSLKWDGDRSKPFRTPAYRDPDDEAVPPRMITVLLWHVTAWQKRLDYLGRTGRTFIVQEGYPNHATRLALLKAARLWTGVMNRLWSAYAPEGPRLFAAGFALDEGVDNIADTIANVFKGEMKAHERFRIINESLDALTHSLKEFIDEQYNSEVPMSAPYRIYRRNRTGARSECTRTQFLSSTCDDDDAPVLDNGESGETKKGDSVNPVVVPY